MKKYIFLFILFSVTIVASGFSAKLIQAQTSCPQVPSSPNSVTATVTIGQDGTYKVWSRILPPDNVNNSFWLQIDGECAINVGDAAAIPPNAYSWVSYRDGGTTNDILATLTAGNHTIKITEREGGVILDRVLFSLDTACVPTGLGDNCPAATVVPTAEPTPTQSPTPLPTSTPVLTLTPTSTPTMTPTPLPTATPTRTPTPTPFLTATPTPIPQGLFGAYYDNSNFTGASVVRRDSTINFNWGTGSPIAGISKDTFSIRWTGKVIAPTTGTYTFRTYSDDGVRLWVNGTRIINNWTNHSATYNTGTISLTAGQKYPIQMDYYENGSKAVIQMQWKVPGSSNYVTVPASQLWVQ